MEAIVIDIAASSNSVLDARCDPPVNNCVHLSYHSCEGTSSKRCLTNFPRPVGCQADGAYMSEESGVRFPLSTDTASLSED